MLFKPKEGFKVFYECLLKTVDKYYSNPTKLDNELQTIIYQKEWENICYRPMQITNFTKLQWLQFMIINNILGTNSLFNQMELLDSYRCSFCKLET